MATKPALKTQIKPLDDRIVVTRVEAEEKTAGGIFLPENAKEKPTQGRVLAVGDIIIFGKYSGTEIAVDGVDVIILRENDLLAKLG
jgi:chaperonin GroES